VYNNIIMSKKISRQQLGIKPVNIRWNIVRGDTSSIRVQFLELDESTSVNISSWQFEATAFNNRERIFDELEVRREGNEVVITANSDLTEFWGTGVSTTVAELTFDLQVAIDRFTIWTPIVGTITVIGDVTGGRL
jgi:hypothetical protein